MRRTIAVFGLMMTLFFESTAEAAVPMPSGWRLVSDSDLKQANVQSKLHLGGADGKYLRADGDFDGDGTPDQARMLLNDSLHKAALFFFPATGQAPVLVRTFAMTDVVRVGVRSAPPGAYSPTCDRGVGKDCDESPVTITHESIDLFMEEASSSYFYIEQGRVVSVSVSD